MLILIAFASSCHKDKPQVLPTGTGVYIVNEGNFNFGNGEISFYDPNTNETSNNLFQSVNGYSLGDVVQSMYIKDSIAFIVVNNSQKIEMVKIPSFREIRSIVLAGSSPRYVLPVNDSIAYVTELYANKIWVINYQNGTVVKGISVPQYTEHMVKADEYVFAEGKKIYADTSSRGALLRIRISDATYVDKREFNGDAEGILLDAANHIWIATDEDAASSTKAAFHCFDKNFNAVSTYSMSSFGFHPHHFSGGQNGAPVWYVSGSDIYKVDNFSFPGSAIVHPSASNIYSMDVDPKNGDVYVSDVLDYVQQSKIYRYDKNGSLIHSFNAGIISGNFAFNHD
jgi:DNA-binding beta-propeller fold protein YncE